MANESTHHRRAASRFTVASFSFFVVVLYLLATTVRVYVRRYFLFVPDYVRWSMTPAQPVQGTKHIFVLFVDHFEPDSDVVRTKRWAARYRSLAARHRDGNGRPPQHTWFYPGEQYQAEVLSELRELTRDGLGEVELHFHHGWDTAETLTVKLRKAIDQFQQFGFLETENGETRFAFVHGNFDLDNSMGPEMCGVSNELELLHDLGCFADFSFPSVYRDAQPDIVNAIYAAKDDDRPKSYERRLPLASLFDGSADLMMFQGPLVLAPSLHVRRLFLDVDDANLHAAMPASPERVERWLRANVHVPERPDWVFIKLWAHGASSADDEEATLGPSFDRTLTYFEQHYNDGTRYALHYITAREAYNLAMAAARSAKGPPEPYLNADIKPYMSGLRPPPPQPAPTLNRSPSGPPLARRAKRSAS